MDRRTFLGATASCGAHVFLLSRVARSRGQEVLAAENGSRVVAEEAWGRLERVADGAWALISTPFASRDFTTVCNGGIIAGDDRVLAIESFMNPRGAAWLAEEAERLTGKRPTDVVSTHYHADHTAGHRGYAEGGAAPTAWLTGGTREAAEASFTERGQGDNAFENVSLLDADGPTTLDLGNRRVRIAPRSGHTASDVTIELADPSVVWTGDLFFNRMFPNYGDAVPSKLNAYASHMAEAKGTTYVPGHGPLADHDAVVTYQEFLKTIQGSARAAFEQGATAEAAAQGYELPEPFDQWMVWAPDNIKKAFDACYREWSAQPTG